MAIDTAAMFDRIEFYDALEVIHLQENSVVTDAVLSEASQVIGHVAQEWH